MPKYIVLRLIIVGLFTCAQGISFADQKDEYDISKRNMKMVDERITDTLHSGRNKKDIETITNDIAKSISKLDEQIRKLPITTENEAEPEPYM